MSCAEVVAKYGLDANCCSSCHEDVEYGFPLMEIDLDDPDSPTVCCWVLTAYDEHRSAASAAGIEASQGIGKPRSSGGLLNTQGIPM